MSLKRKVNGVFVDVVEPEIAPGTPGTVLTTDKGGSVTWSSPQNKFRGVWEPDTLARQFDFGSGIPTEFTPVVVDAAAKTPTAAGVPGSGVSGSAAPFTQAVRVGTTNINLNFRSALSLNLANLGIENVTRVTCLAVIQDGFSTSENYVRMSMWRNGAVVTSMGDAADGSASSFASSTTWTTLSTPAGSDDVIQIGMRAGAALGNYDMNGFFTGVRIYATDRPYMLGEFVTHNGKMWRSLLDNNSGTPGVSGWAEALTLPQSSGTTASRPSAATAGVGYYYFDTTLGRPIWSTGSAWVDATGATV